MLFHRVSNVNQQLLQTFPNNFKAGLVKYCPEFMRYLSVCFYFCQIYLESIDLNCKHFNTYVRMVKSAMIYPAG